MFVAILQGGCSQAMLPLFGRWEEWSTEFNDSQTLHHLKGRWYPRADFKAQASFPRFLWCYLGVSLWGRMGTVFLKRKIGYFEDHVFRKLWLGRGWGLTGLWTFKTSERHLSVHSYLCLHLHVISCECHLVSRKRNTELPKAWLILCNYR